MKIYWEVQCWDKDESRWEPYTNDMFESESEAIDWIKGFDENTQSTRSSKDWFRVHRTFLLEPSKSN